MPPITYVRPDIARRQSLRRPKSYGANPVQEAYEIAADFTHDPSTVRVQYSTQKQAETLSGARMPRLLNGGGVRLLNGFVPAGIADWVGTGLLTKIVGLISSVVPGLSGVGMMARSSGYAMGEPRLQSFPSKFASRGLGPLGQVGMRRMTNDYRMKPGLSGALGMTGTRSLPGAYVFGPGNR